MTEKVDSTQQFRKNTLVFANLIHELSFTVGKLATGLELADNCIKEMDRDKDFDDDHLITESVIKEARELIGPSMLEKLAGNLTLVEHSSILVSLLRDSISKRDSQIAELESVTKELLQTMLLQQDRMNEKAHISAEAFTPIWDAAIYKARELLKC